MPTTNKDKQAAYAKKSRQGVRNLTRASETSDTARLASKEAWDAKYVGVIRNYPRSAEAFEARRERGRAAFAKMRAEGNPLTRVGVPDGWGGRKQELATARATAVAKAEAAVGEMVAVGQLDIGEWAANEALRVAYSFAFDETLKADTRLRAIKIIAEFTKTKPTQSVKVEVSAAERWLMSLAEDVESDSLDS